MKVVQVNIQVRDSCALRTLRVVPMNEVTTENIRTNHVAESLCASLRRAVSRSVVQGESVSMQQCFLSCSLYHQLMPRVWLLMITFRPLGFCFDG